MKMGKAVISKVLLGCPRPAIPTTAKRPNTPRSLANKELQAYKMSKELSEDDRGRLECIFLLISS